MTSANTSSTVVATLTVGEPSASLISRLNAECNKTGPMRLSSLIESMVGGAVNGKIELAIGAVAASGTITLTFANIAAADTVTVGGVVFTARASGATGAEFNIQTNATVTAANFAAAINAQTALAAQLTASAASGVVTITAVNEGAAGNYIVLATSKPTGFALVQPTGGSDGTRRVYRLGIA
jgi:phage tail sheath gpL-like